MCDVMCYNYAVAPNYIDFYFSGSGSAGAGTMEALNAGNACTSSGLVRIL